MNDSWLITFFTSNCCIDDVITIKQSVNSLFEQLTVFLKLIQNLVNKSKRNKPTRFFISKIRKKFTGG